MVLWNKILKDSYTSQFVKLQMISLLSAILFLLVFIISKHELCFFISIIFLLLIIVFSIPKAIFISKKELILGIMVFPLDYITTVIFVLGSLLGVIKLILMPFFKNSCNKLSEEYQKGYAVGIKKRSKQL